MPGVKYYTSEDAGAPVLSGQAGALIALLDKVLVDGYGSKAPLGWTKPYSGTNKAVYRLDHTLNSGRYLRVDDSNAQYAIVNAYDAMSDVDTGIDGFPAIATPRYWRKSNLSDTSARSWAIYGDEAIFYPMLKWHPTNGGYGWHVFGDVIPLDDALGPRTIFTGSPNISESFPGQNILGSTTNTASNDAYKHCIPDHLNEHTSGAFGLFGNFAVGTAVGNGRLAYPGLAGSDLRASELLVVRTPGTTATSFVLGALPGVLALWSAISNAQADTLHGTTQDDLIDGDGRTYRYQIVGVGSLYTVVAIDLTGPWR